MNQDASGDATTEDSTTEDTTTEDADAGGAPVAAWPRVAPSRRRGHEADGAGAGDDLGARWALTGRRPTRSRWAGALAVVLIVALAVLAAVEGLDLRHDDQLASARRSALAAAISDAKLIATYSYGNFSNYSKMVEARSTPAFASNFEKDSSSLGSILSQYKASSKGSVTGAGVGTLTSGTATVYVFLDETVANTSAKSTTERARMMVTLTRQHGRWLISNAVVE